MSLHRYLSELNGYLKAIQHLNGPAYSFGVKWFYLEDGFNGFIHNYDHKYNFSKSTAIEFKEIKERILGFALNGMLDQEKFSGEKALNYYKEMIIEDINEYYGLASSSENSAGVFHPLVKGPVYRLDIDGKDQSSYFYFLIRIENIFVLTYFLESKIIDKE